MAPKVAKVEMNEEELKLKQKLMDDMELKKLKREHRRMKSIGKRDDAIERQGKVITALTKERDNLVSDLNVMQTKKQCVMDAKQTAEITELFARGDSLDVDIAREQRFMDDLKYQTYKESNKLERRRKNIKSQFSASDYRQHMENQRGDRALDALKSKLHAEQVKLGSAIKENAELRKSILLLLKSKTHFNQLFEELVLKLKKGKKIMKDIVEQSQLQLKKRDEVTRKIQALKQRDVADLHKRQEEMQDLEMRYADDKNLTKFRNMVLHVRTKLSEGDKATKKAAAQRLQQEEELQKLRDTWTAVKEVTELEECGDVCELLFRQEAENFSLFNYNNELHDQVEALTEQTAELLKKVDDEQEDRYQWEDQQERRLACRLYRTTYTSGKINKKDISASPYLIYCVRTTLLFLKQDRSASKSKLANSNSKSPLLQNKSKTHCKAKFKTYRLALHQCAHVKHATSRLLLRTTSLALKIRLHSLLDNIDGELTHFGSGGINVIKPKGRQQRDLREPTDRIDNDSNDRQPSVNWIAMIHCYFYSRNVRVSYHFITHLYRISAFIPVKTHSLNILFEGLLISYHTTLSYNRLRESLESERSVGLISSFDLARLCPSYMSGRRAL
ncbi:Coiled-coil domain-containing protein 63 [Homalodisca vitripennis]|nr:Coiled-coil domain-containing protein 63 [Homalodisca vitripennis]